MKITNCPKLMIKYLLVLIIALSAVFVFVNRPNPALAADGPAKALEGAKNAASVGFGDSFVKGGVMTSLPTAIGRVVGAVLAFVGTLFLLLIIYGGILWMTDRGNEDQVKKARDLIQAAVIGLVIVLAAYAITSYIGSALTESGTSVPTQE